jgi:hypothetical protein
MDDHKQKKRFDPSTDGYSRMVTLPFLNDYSRLIYPIVSIPNDGEMTIPRIAHFDHDTQKYQLNRSNSDST